MRGAPPSRRFLLALLLAGLGLPGCGGGSGENRPVVVGSNPEAFQVLDNVVDEFLIVYDEPVRILNPNQARGIDARGELPMLVFRDAFAPNRLRVRPAPGVFLRPGKFALQLGAGLEVNGDDQYRLEEVVLPFEFGDGPNMFLGSRARAAVVEVDPESFVEVSATPTPGGRVPYGLRGSQIGNDVRVWVQLDAGGGDGRSVAWFRPGDASMTEIQLTTGGGDLVSTNETLALGRRGDSVYAAFRDEALGAVRLSEIDLRTALEVRTLLLSPPPGPDTEPLSIRTSPLGADVLVACRSGSEYLLVAVRIDEFEERNLGPEPGADGFPLEEGGGALTTWGETAIVANRDQPTGSVTAVRWTAPVEAVGQSPSRVTGSPADVTITPDGLWLLTALADFEDDVGLVRRSRAVFYDPVGRTVGTTTGGGNPPATTVRKFVLYRTQARFLTLFDNDAMALWAWSTLGLVQQDMDEALEGIQAVDLTTIAPDAVSGTFVSGIFPD